MKRIIVATLDDRTSEICLKRHGEIFEAREAEVGETIPPFHLNCRSIVIPFDEKDFIANGGAEDYEGWLEDYIGRYYGEDAGSGDDVNKRIEDIRKQLWEPGISLWEMKMLERELEKLSGEIGVDGAGDFIIVNGWLKLYKNPTVSKAGRKVDIPSGAKKSFWYAFEGLSDINYWARKILEEAGKAVVVNIGNKGELTDEDGRYWVAVGPKVMNPDHKDDKSVMADEMNYGTKIDAVIEDSKGNIFYLPLVVDEGKEHTYSNGIYQTGYKFPSGNEYVSNESSGIIDNSVIEFVGERINEHGLSEFKIVCLVVYDL